MNAAMRDIVSAFAFGVTFAALFAVSVDALGEQRMERRVPQWIASAADQSAARLQWEEMDALYFRELCKRLRPDANGEFAAECRARGNTP